MKAIMVMYDSLCRRYLSTYGCSNISTPNFDRLAAHGVTFDNCYVGSMPCMPARRELHTGRHNFMHRSWGPIEPFDDSMPELLDKAGIHSHLASDHQHYWEDGGATYHTRYSTWENSRGQEGDPWKGVLKDPDLSGRIPHTKPHMKETMRKLGMKCSDEQDMVNRLCMDTEDKMAQAVTFKNGLEFIDTNHDEDNWFLQIETFDPHEPFFASERFKAMYQDPDYDGLEFDWPSYQKVQETPAEQQRCINNYKALVSMCDYYLGQVLDAMDKYHLWDDTMLIVNTDHGFILTEHGWWGKSTMPHYNEVAHIPMFIWDPRSRKMGERRESLVQNIDIAPTVLRYFGMEPTKDMCGFDLADTIANDTKVRDYAVFGTLGEHFNITDGRYVYMRCPIPGKPVYEYTLMPTHMRSRFSMMELQDIQLAEPFDFTKGARTMKIRGGVSSFNFPAKFGEPLFDLSTDPGELAPIRDDETELRMANAIRVIMNRNDAPDELYDLYGLKKDRDLTMDEFLAEKAAWDHLTFPGLEGYEMDMDIFASLSMLKLFSPAEQFNPILGGLAATCDAMKTNRITKTVFTAFVQSLPIPEEQKAVFLAQI